MDYNWETCSEEIKKFVYHLVKSTDQILHEDLIGFYLHGSFAMGGFNPNKSDIDILVVTKNALSIENKRKLANLFLVYSSHPFPVEISFLDKKQLDNWRYPTPYDFHYSEYWREKYEVDISQGKIGCFGGEEKFDADLAAHITVTNQRGICLLGSPIEEVFPEVPPSHYISSIMSDFEECLENIEHDPIYCTLNLIRVYWYLKEGTISSKEEAGKWGLIHLPKECLSTMHQVIHAYASDQKHTFESSDLFQIRDYLKREVYGL